MRRFRPSRSTLVYVAYLAAVGLAFSYLLLVGQRAHSAYSFLKSDHLGFRGQVHRADPELGFAAVPGAQGFHVFPVGPPFPMRYDADGFRIRYLEAGQGEPLVWLHGSLLVDQRLIDWTARLVLTSSE